MIVGFDEFTTGSFHRPNNRKKTMTLGINFLNLGQDALCQDMTWFIPIVVRTCIINQVRGGFSCMLKIFLRRALFGRLGLATAGVLLKTVRGGQRLTVALTAELWAMLSDGDGLRQALDWRGASALRPCFKHAKIWKLDSCTSATWPLRNLLW